ncbi:MAG: beta-N-acetylhexosaminidase, partial [Terrimicrobiaceae bacterium]
MKLIPQPKSCRLGHGHWIKSHEGKAGAHIAVFANPPDLLDTQAAVLRDFLTGDQMFGVVRVECEQECDIALLLSLEPRPHREKPAAAGFADERYRIGIKPGRICIEAAAPQGIACAIQTLRQMLSGQRAKLALPCQVIDDEPAMAWRGLHLDASRHFWDVAVIKRHLDLMALHKFNVFHWHLTDDQGWRLPVEGYPKLTEIAAWRSGTMIGHENESATNPSDNTRHGGFYTHEEIREIVAYAAARGIHVLPEVDLPGHVQALVAAYPEFGTAPAPGVRQSWGISPYALNLEPATFRFLEDLVAALAGLFPFRYVHLGGDEVMTGQWEA